MARLSPVTRASLCLCDRMSPSSVGSVDSDWTTKSGDTRRATPFPVLTGEQGVRNVCPRVSQSARPGTPGFPFQSGWRSDFSHCSFAVKEPPPVFLYYERTTRICVPGPRVKSRRSLVSTAAPPAQGFRGRRQGWGLGRHWGHWAWSGPPSPCT